MPFEPGREKTGGRKPGSLNKDTRNYLDFQLWFKKVMDDLELLEKPEDRIAVEMQIIDRMLSKTPTLPGTPGQSVENVDKMIEAYESQKTAENVNA